MSIKLLWDFFEDNEDATNVYRSESPIDENALPAPLVTLTGGEREYTDDAVDPLKVYHYRFGKVIGAEETLSKNQSYYSSRYRGPGPQELVSGNYHQLGYFGTLTEEEFLTAGELSFRCDFDKGVLFQDRNSRWLKLFHDGKIKYVRLDPICHSVSWSDLYQAGLVFEGPGTHETEVSADIINAIGAHSQGKVIERGLDRFKVRLIRRYPVGTDPTSENTSKGNVERNGSEWNELFYPLYARTELGGLSNKAIGAPGILPNALGSSSTGYACWHAETEATGLNAVRAGNFGLGALDAAILYSYIANNDAYSWFPVLEYLPNY